MAALPVCMELSEAIVVHGAFEPGVPLDAQLEDVMLGLKSGEKYLKARSAKPWYDLYDGPKPVIVGHHDYGHDHKPLVRPRRVYAIDTGVARGGTLTAVILPGFELVSIQSHEDYWARTKRAWEEARG